MKRLLFGIAIAVAAVLAVALLPAPGRPEPGSLHAGKVIRLRDGSRYTLLGRDPGALRTWRVRVGRTWDGRPVVVSLDAEDLAAAERGEYPPFPGLPPGTTNHMAGR